MCERAKSEKMIMGRGIVLQKTEWQLVGSLYQVTCGAHTGHWYVEEDCGNEQWKLWIIAGIEGWWIDYSSTISTCWVLIIKLYNLIG